MFTSSRKVALLLTLMSLLFAGSMVRAAEFSADVSVTGAITATGTIFARGEDLRQETVQGKQQAITILNVGKRMLWRVDPASKSYLGQPIPAAKLAEVVSGMRGRVPTGAAAEGLKMRRLGTEKVSGYLCDKTLLEKQGTRLTVWFSKQLDLALRLEVTDSSGGKKTTARQEVKNIKLRKLEASLFAPPKGYKEVKLPQGPAGAPAPKGRGK